MLRLKTSLGLTALFLLSVALLASPALAAPPDEPRGPRPTSYTLPGTDVFPEGIAFQQSTGSFFVSSTSDGAIFRGHILDESAEVFLPGGEDGRTTAIGLAVDDRRDRLFVAGGGTGQVFVYGLPDGDLLAALDNGLASGTFVNDVTVTRSGDAFLTDSFAPVLYRVTTDAGGNFVLEEWLNFTGTAIQYQPGFNLNGIVATANDKYLIVVQSNTGKLFRIDRETKQVTEIALSGQPTALTSGDGLVLRGHTLYVVRNSLEQIAEVRLGGDFTSGTVVSTTTDPSFDFPTTATQARGRLLVVNSQFDERNNPADPPENPFTVSSIRLP